MKSISRKLTIIYMSLAALTLVIILLYETDILETGVLEEKKQSEFILTALMELVSLGAAFLGLRLFKFKVVHNDLINRQEPAMMKWGTVRLLILELPMLVDTLLYYIYMNTKLVIWQSCCCFVCRLYFQVLTAVWQKPPRKNETKYRYCQL